MSILEDLGEFQWFWVVLEERKQKKKKKEEEEEKGRVLNTQENFQKLADQTFSEYLGLIAILKEELKEMSFMKLVDDLKSLILYKDWPKNQSI